MGIHLQSYEWRGIGFERLKGMEKLHAFWKMFGPSFVVLDLFGLLGFMHTFWEELILRKLRFEAYVVGVRGGSWSYEI